MLRIGDRVVFKKCYGFYGKVKTKISICENALIFGIMLDDSSNIWMWESDLIRVVVICV